MILRRGRPSRCGDARTSIHKLFERHCGDEVEEKLLGIGSLGVGSLRVGSLRVGSLGIGMLYSS